jgi:hypothetical protein
MTTPYNGNAANGAGATVALVLPTDSDPQGAGLIADPLMDLADHVANLKGRAALKDQANTFTQQNVFTTLRAARLDIPGTDGSNLLVGDAEAGAVVVGRGDALSAITLRSDVTCMRGLAVIGGGGVEVLPNLGYRFSGVQTRHLVVGAHEAFGRPDLTTFGTGETGTGNIYPKWSAPAGATLHVACTPRLPAGCTVTAVRSLFAHNTGFTGGVNFTLSRLTPNLGTEGFGFDPDPDPCLYGQSHLNSGVFQWASLTVPSNWLVSDGQMLYFEARMVAGGSASGLSWAGLHITYTLPGLTPAV